MADFVKFLNKFYSVNIEALFIHNKLTVLQERKREFYGKQYRQ